MPNKILEGCRGKKCRDGESRRFFTRHSPKKALRKQCVLINAAR